ncbi:MAG: DUF4114 domain-containing protein [Chthonomonadetes bacterium]|nr:DUF4114 domain-containing protein [Chthonomonadetes bacterium]
MKRFVLVALVVGLAFAMSGAWALTLGPTVVGTWTSGWTANNDGAEYWDNRSSDGTPPGNIGFQSFVAGESYLNDGSGGAVLDVWFTTSGPDWAAIKIEIAGLANQNKFGVYKQGDPSTKKQLFDGSAGPASPPVVFNPIVELGTTDFGFYLERGTPNTPGYVIWYSESSLNPDGDGQHFAFFTAPPLVPGLKAYYVGAEDLKLNQSDRDYQDMVVYVANIPDASTWMLFLSGMPAVLMLRRKRS